MNTAEIFKTQLQEHLAFATKLVWKMQNAITEPEPDPQELVRYAEALNQSAGVILGHVSRWELLEREAKDRPPTT